jgi:hypothetical protein
VTFVRQRPHESVHRFKWASPQERLNYVPGHCNQHWTFLSSLLRANAPTLDRTLALVTTLWSFSLSASGPEPDCPKRTERQFRLSFPSSSPSLSLAFCGLQSLLAPRPLPPPTCHVAPEAPIKRSRVCFLRHSRVPPPPIVLSDALCGCHAHEPLTRLVHPSIRSFGLQNCPSAFPPGGASSPVLTTLASDHVPPSSCFFVSVFKVAVAWSGPAWSCLQLPSVDRF